jgi:hypothetical protein
MRAHWQRGARLVADTVTLVIAALSRNSLPILSRRPYA